MDLEKLLRPGYEYARELLADHDTFPPFAILVDIHGEESVIVAEDGLLETVVDAVAKRHRHTPLYLVALFAQAELHAHGQLRQRLVRVHVQMRRGLNKLVLTPYLKEDGVLKIGIPSVRDADAPVLEDLSPA